jgi:hypothetical protein
MINPFADVNWRPDHQDRRAFAKSWIVGFPAIALVLAVLVRWRTGVWGEWPWWVGGLGLVVGVVCLAWPTFARPIYVVWYAVGGAIGFVASNLFLIATFYLVVTPIGIVLKCLRKDSLERRPDRDAQSYWKDAEKPVDLKHYFRQF